MKKFIDLSDTKQAVTPLTSSAALTPIPLDCTGYGRVKYTFNLGLSLAGGSFNASIFQASTSGATFSAITSGSLTVISSVSTPCVAVIDVPVVNSYPWQEVSCAVANSNIPVGVVAELYRPVNVERGSSAQQTVTV